MSGSPAATVIIRTRDSAATVDAALRSVRDQTVDSEVVVVDSGSRDATLRLVRPWCDRLIEMRARDYRPGRALNLGAAAASAPVHVALSSHCRLPRRDWLERALSHFGRADVAGATGARRLPNGEPMSGVYHQRPQDPRTDPWWGFSNHASSWRASVWRAIPFSETLVTAEDKEWGLRVLDAGWTIAFEAALVVLDEHRWRQRTVDLFRRERLERTVVGSYLDLPPYGVRDLLRDWWQPADPRYWRPLHRLSHRRVAWLLGTYAGHRAARRREPPASPYTR